MCEQLPQDLLPRFRAIVAMGGNIGDVHATMQEALQCMNGLPFTSLEAVSLPFVSSPVDAMGPDFLNAVAVLQTALAPTELLHALQAIELAHGRERLGHNAPRTLDLDVIWMEAAQRDTLELTLPHPRWQIRAFVLEPMAQVWTQSLATKAGAWPDMPSKSERQELMAKQAIAPLPKPFSSINGLISKQGAWLPAQSGLECSALNPELQFSHLN